MDSSIIKYRRENTNILKIKSEYNWRYNGDFNKKENNENLFANNLKNHIKWNFIGKHKQET